MPELPEVETIRRQIERYLPLRIEQVYYSEHIESLLQEKKFSPKGRNIVAIERKGKMLDFVLDDGRYILSQLGMSGGWRVSGERVKEKHTHFQMKCMGKEGEVFLAYVDPRRFGNLYFVDENLRREKLDHLGIDVSSPEFTVKVIEEMFAKHSHKKIKSFLLEQQYFAGIGNYMASEICALSGILPTRLLGEITGEEIGKIKKAVGKVIRDSIKSNGMSFHGGYADTQGMLGGGLDHLVVFHKEICGMCKKGKVVRTVLGGRGTYHCPRCQH